MLRVCLGSCAIAGPLRHHSSCSSHFTEDGRLIRQPRPPWPRPAARAGVALGPLPAKHPSLPGHSTALPRAGSGPRAPVSQCKQQSPSLLPPRVTTATGDGAAGRERGVPSLPARAPGAAPLLPPSLPPSDLLQLIKLFKQSLCGSVFSVPGMARGHDFGTALGKKGQSWGCWTGAGGDGDEGGHQHCHLQLRAQSIKKLQLGSSCPARELLP